MYDEDRTALSRKVEESYFRFFRRRGELAPQSERQSALRWRALEDILALGEPEFYDTVEMNEAVCILIVIEGAAHLISTTEDGATISSVGLLGGGTYEERITITDNDYGVVGSFEHPNLPAPLIVSALNWDAWGKTREIREKFREWASSARFSRVQTFPLAK